MIHTNTNANILQSLDDVVYGHIEAKKALINLVNRSKIRHYQKFIEAVPASRLMKPSKCLLLGGSGTGKTFLVKTLSEHIKFPFLSVDATKFNHTGAVGGIKTRDLQRMIVKKAQEYVDNNPTMYFSLEGTVDQMVVFVDEFDKISSHYDGGSSGKWNESTQSHFLTMFDNYEEFAGVSWVFAGAFSGIKTKEVRQSIGFNSCSDENDNAIADITDEDVINYGLLPEIVGRMSSICSLDDLSVEDYVKIMEKCVIPDKLSELSYFGIDDTGLSKDDVYDIASKASDSGQGVRYLQRELDKRLLDLEFNYENTRYGLEEQE